MSYHRVKGCYDILPEADEPWKQSSIWHFVETKARQVAESYGFQEVILPAFEYTEVFTRSVGEESDIVSKEMYTFEDKAGRSISLRPELTAPLIRAYIENGLHHKTCSRFFYFGPCWRYDRAQKGRYRQFYQFGIEVIEQTDPLIDVETIALLLDVYKAVGLKNTTLLLNSIGDKETRSEYAKALRDYFKPHLPKLSEDSQRRYETNPLRILDSKAKDDREISQNAPKIFDYLTIEAGKYFDTVCKRLSELGIRYTIDQNMVRGLDYYSNTVYEVVRSDDLGAQSSIGAGGRYDGLMKQLAGPDLPGVGFGTGVERIIQSMMEEKCLPEQESKLDFYVIPLAEEVKTTCFHHLMTLRRSGATALLHYKNYNAKKAFQEAVEHKARFALIVGEEEEKNKRVKIKDLATREERDEPISFLKEVKTIL